MKNILLVSILFCACITVACKKTQTKPSAQQEVPSLMAYVPPFTTTDIAGTPVTNDIFSHADVTVLNVWGTFCGPCIGEMPELGAWARTMPDNVQLIGLIADVTTLADTDGLEIAQEIITGSQADFLHLIANADFEPFMRGMQFVPTTFLIDREGGVIGEPIIGARVALYKMAVENYLAKE